jgi:hypothetical protein
MKTVTAILPIIAALLIYGCAGPDGGKINVVTPARIEAVAAIGTYVGGKEMIADGHQKEIERVIAGLTALQRAGKPDMVAVAAALMDAGITWLATPEGTLAIGVVTSFEDVWAATGQVALGSEYGQAVCNGALRGLTLAMSADKDSARGGPTVESQLRAKAAATRPGI